MTYVREALGTNGDNGIILGQPVDIGPMAYGNFVKELEAERGPFVFFTFEEVQQSAIPTGELGPKMFVTWLTLYNPDALAYISKVMMLKGMTEKKPSWLDAGTIRFKQGDYDLYLASMYRIQRIVDQQGTIEANLLDHKNFLEWWGKHDRAGMSAFMVISGIAGESFKAPAQLFEYWKATEGKSAPPSSLLGLGLWSMIKRNWLWIGAGAVGGAVAFKVLKRRQDIGEDETMMANCGCCGGIE